MANKPHASKHRDQGGTRKTQGEPAPLLLQTEDKSEVAKNRNDKAAESTKSAKPTPPARLKEIGGWFKRKAGEAHLADWAMVVFTLIIAFATITYTIYARRQWKVMSGELTEIHNSGIDTHKLSEATLAASRAWILVQGTGFGMTKDKNFPQGQVILTDSGNSPAVGLDGWSCVEVRAYEPPLQDGRLQKSPTAVCLPIFGGTLGRGVPITINAFVPSKVPANFSLDTNGNGPHFYYWGTVTYEIYPSDGRRHSTSFCLKNGGNQFSPCSEGGYQAD